MEYVGKKCLRIIGSTVLLILLASQIVKAQNAPDVLRYSLQYPEGDPISMIMPATSYAAGFASYQQNPASVAFFDHSFLAIGLSDQYVSEKGTYLFNTATKSNNQFNVGDVGFVYKVPTSRGKLVVGLGYSQSHDFNRAVAGYGYNNISSITDYYASSFSSNDLFTLAYNTFTISKMYDNKGNYLYSISVFEDPQDPQVSNKISDHYRSLPAGVHYLGINQNFNSVRHGTLGEYSLFFGVEIIKNLEIGASIGIISGNYDYKRNFLETDTKNAYNANLIDSNDDGVRDTDVDHILSVDEVHDNFSGFTARIGFIYQVSPHFNIGAAYQFKNVLHIDENFSTHITNTLDNGTFFKDKILRKNKYKVVRPARFNFGISLIDLSGLTISASGQRIKYSTAHLEFVNPPGSSFKINHFIQSNFKDVINFRVGLAYQVSDRFTPRIGYGHYPSPVEYLDATRNFYSAGFSVHLSNSTVFNVGAQLGIWNDQQILYRTIFAPNGFEAVDVKVKHWNIMAGLTFNF